MTAFPALPEDWEPTRATLHAYAHAVSAIPRVHAAPHARWWHISFKADTNGLVTDSFQLPAGGTALVRMDLRSHEIVFVTDGGERRSFSMAEGLTGTEMGDALIKAASEFGLGGEYERDKFQNDDSRAYEPADATAFSEALVVIDRALTTHRNRVAGDVGPVQLWPHGFDIAFEWFGTKTVAHEEDGETVEMPSQINFGLYPAGAPYFYSTPWPFDRDALLAVALPSGARWNTDGWEGSIMEYADVVDRADGVERLLDYFGAVFEAASPLLAK